jgi:hypothetical protein
MSEFADSPLHPEEPIEVDGELVAEARPLPAAWDAQPGELAEPTPASLPAALAAATGGFVLGVVAFMLLKFLRQPAAARSMSRRRRKMIAKRRGAEVVDTRSFLVDVHLLKR